MSKQSRLELGLPSGSLRDATVNLLGRAGYRLGLASRSYQPEIDDPEIGVTLFRAQEIAHYVERGVADAGITGRDWVAENDADRRRGRRVALQQGDLAALPLGDRRPGGLPIRTVKDLEGKRIASELVGVTRRFLAERGVEAEVEFSWGATEVKAGIPGVADAIVDGTETGSSLRANRLRIVETLLESTTRLIANRDSWSDPWKRQKIRNLFTLMTGALEAESKVGLKMNVPRARLDELMEMLPALHTPTISSQVDGDWVAGRDHSDEKIVRDLIPRLKRSGAEGIIEYPLNKVVY